MKAATSFALYLSVILILASCQMVDQFSPRLDPEHSKIAIDFAAALLEGNYELAHGLLSPELKHGFSPEDLHLEFELMYSGYSEGEPTQIMFDPQFTMTNWPGKRPGDIGWVYVSIVGDDFVEAITVVISDIEGEYLISEIEWGRP
jgi:hypothetical protein